MWLSASLRHSSGLIATSLDDFDKAVILDIGSGNFRIGMSGDVEPMKTFRNTVGHAKYPMGISLSGFHDLYINEEEITRSGAVGLNWPVHHGIVKDWKDFERIISYAVRSERISLEEHQVLMCVSPLCTHAQFEKMSEILFETFNVPSVAFQPTDALSLLAHRKTTGLVVESGEGVTTVSAYIDAYKWILSSKSVKIGGRSVTSYLRSKINENVLAGTSGWVITEGIKEHQCFVPLDYEEAKEKAKSKEINWEWKMPNGKTKNLNVELVKTGDFMFRPRIWGIEMPGIHEMARDAIQRCKPEDRLKMWQNIVLAGGNTLMKGFVERFKSEMQKLAPEGVTVKVIADEKRINAPFEGGSLVSEMSTFGQITLTREDYEDSGTKEEIIAERFTWK